MHQVISWKANPYKDQPYIAKFVNPKGYTELTYQKSISRCDQLIKILAHAALFLLTAGIAAFIPDFRNAFKRPVEKIYIQNKSWSALRMQQRFRERFERRRPVREAERKSLEKQAQLQSLLSNGNIRTLSDDELLKLLNTEKKESITAHISNDNATRLHNTASRLEEGDLKTDWLNRLDDKALEGEAETVTINIDPQVENKALYAIHVSAKKATLSPGPMNIDRFPVLKTFQTLAQRESLKPNTEIKVYGLLGTPEVASDYNMHISVSKEPQEITDDALRGLYMDLQVPHTLGQKVRADKIYIADDGSLFIKANEIDLTKCEPHPVKHNMLGHNASSDELLEDTTAKEFQRIYDCCEGIEDATDPTTVKELQRLKAYLTECQNGQANAPSDADNGSNGASA